KISCLHITHMRRCEIFSAPCIWANSEFLEAPFIFETQKAGRITSEPYRCIAPEGQLCYGFPRQSGACAWLFISAIADAGHLKSGKIQATKHACNCLTALNNQRTPLIEANNPDTLF
ncbi:MAG: hypothetical protein ACLQHK_11090, partial [Gallionellaceae bacterium]